MASNDDLRNRFTYHAPDEGKIARHAAIRSAGHDLARLVAQAAPAGREQSLALTKIEEAVMWANAAIAREMS